MRTTVFFGSFIIMLVFGLVGCDIENAESNVTFDLNGGNINGNTFSVNIQIKSGETIENLPNPTKEDNIFGGWFAEQNGLGNEFTTSTKVASNITVYAKWLWDNEFLKLAYDQNYKYPTGFYYENDLAGSVYYVNTLSIKPIAEREPPFIESHTLDKEEAKYWSVLTETYGSGNRVFVSEKETEKYFEFLWVDKYEYILLSRVHKTDYFIPLAELQDKFRKPNNTLGIYNGELTKSNIKELIEYLWDYPVGLHYGNKVIESVITEKEDRFEHNIQSLEMVFGDWGVRDHIRVYDNKFVFDKETRILTFVEKIKTDELFGRQN